MWGVVSGGREPLGSAPFNLFPGEEARLRPWGTVWNPACGVDASWSPRGEGPGRSSRRAGRGGAPAASTSGRPRRGEPARNLRRGGPGPRTTSSPYSGSDVLCSATVITHDHMDPCLTQSQLIDLIHFWLIKPRVYQGSHFITLCSSLNSKQASYISMKQRKVIKKPKGKIR
ncbi:uncharacterized protein [Equus caballus]|uniref:uncharacterized protein n=1 Tax=Equus caballus TaxID=9796 RepID=UPI0038B3200A